MTKVSDRLENLQTTIIDRLLPSDPSNAPVPCAESIDQTAQPMYPIESIQLVIFVCDYYEVQFGDVRCASYYSIIQQWFEQRFLSELPYGIANL